MSCQLNNFLSGLSGLRSDVEEIKLAAVDKDICRPRVLLDDNASFCIHLLLGEGENGKRCETRPVYNIY